MLEYRPVMGLYNFISLLGIFFLIAFAYLFSTNRRQISWQVVIWGVGIQMLIALFLFIFPAGTKFFLFINDVVVEIMNSALAGAQFVFGRLAVPPGAGGEPSLGFILAFQTFPTIIFFSSLMSVLYFYNIIPRIIKAFAHLFTKLMNVSGAEALCAASNIFVGVESTMTVRPFLKDMTRSELCAVLAAGMATVSSNVLAVYVFSLHDVFPKIAGHLVSASFMSAPAALVMAKVLLPEEGNPKTRGEHIIPQIEKEGSVFEAIIHGANAGVRLIIGIVALLIAVLGFVALGDQALMFLGNKINNFMHLNWDWSFKGILGVIFYPFTLIIGIPPSDAAVLAKIIGERAVVTEVTAYQHLANLISQGIITNPRSIVITTYALCGFAHIASLAIFIGGITAIVPAQAHALAQVGFRALVAATLACLLTAAVAGVFFVDNAVLFG